MYGDKRTKAFCCECRALTVHEYTAFGRAPEPGAPAKGFLSGLLRSIAHALATDEPQGDYQCTRCGTYLHTPDNLD